VTRSRALAGVLLLLALTHPVLAQSSGQPSSPGAVGVWRGTSVCLVQPSPCHDEVVVYRIAAMSAADSLALDARKIVSGVEQPMGVLGCRLVPRSGELTCIIPRGTWEFNVRNDSLTGELRLPDGTRFRVVRAARAP
jgi:hypothetical protein